MPITNRTVLPGFLCEKFTRFTLSDGIAFICYIERELNLPLYMREKTAVYAA